MHQLLEAQERDQGLEIYNQPGAYSTYEREAGTIPNDGRQSSFGALRQTVASTGRSGPVQGDLFLQPQPEAARIPKQRREIAKRVRAVQVGTLSSRADGIELARGSH